MEQNISKKSSKRNKDGYIVPTKGGFYVGLINYGRTYAPCLHPCTLKVTEQEAMRIARVFNATHIIHSGTKTRIEVI